MPPMDKLMVTPMEDKAMRYLSDKMEVAAGMVGIHVYNRLVRNPTHIGASILSNLRKKGYVMRLPDLKSWRLTRQGREYVSKE